MASDQRKIYVSSDSGKTWSKRSLPSMGSSSDLLMSEVDPSHIVLSAKNNDVCLSTHCTNPYSYISIFHIIIIALPVS